LRRWKGNNSKVLFILTYNKRHFKNAEKFGLRILEPIYEDTLPCLARSSKEDHFPYEWKMVMIIFRMPGIFSIRPVSVE